MDKKILKNKFFLGGIIFILLTLIMVFSNSGNNFADNNILKTISLSQWKSIYDNDKDYVLIDLRTQREINEGFIEGAINIDFYSPDFKNQLNNLDKTKKYLIYCRSGGRSSKALELTKELGFNEVYDLKGGISSWISSGNKIIK